MTRDQQQLTMPLGMHTYRSLSLTRIAVPDAEDNEELTDAFRAGRRNQSGGAAQHAERPSYQGCVLSEADRQQPSR